MTAVFDQETKPALRVIRAQELKKRKKAHTITSTAKLKAVTAHAAPALAELSSGPSAAAPTTPERLMAMATGFAASQVLLTADEFHVFDALAEGGDMSANALAACIGLPVDTLERLLNACCAFGLLKKYDRTFTLTEASVDYLVKGSPKYIGGMFEHLRRDIYPLWQHLNSAVRENAPQWARIPGGNPKGPFETLYQDEARLRGFMDAMFGSTYPAAMEYASRYNFTPFKHIVDVGGASGGFFAAVLKKFPGCRGTIVDLPPVENVARETMEKHGVGDRVDFIAADFFADELPQGADMYVLGFILHDWDTARGTELLKKIYAALKPGGAVFVCETLLNDDKVGPPAASFMDLNMLCATTGRERTPQEYAEWLEEIGFTNVEYEICHGMKSYVVAYK